MACGIHRGQTKLYVAAYTSFCCNVIPALLQDWEMEFHEFAEAIARVAVVRSGRAVQAVGTTEVQRDPPPHS